MRFSEVYKPVMDPRLPSITYVRRLSHSFPIAPQPLHHTLRRSRRRWVALPDIVWIDEKSDAPSQIPRRLYYGYKCHQDVPFTPRITDKDEKSQVSIKSTKEIFTSDSRDLKVSIHSNPFPIHESHNFLTSKGDGASSPTNVPCNCSLCYSNISIKKRIFTGETFTPNKYVRAPWYFRPPGSLVNTKQRNDKSSPCFSEISEEESKYWEGGESTTSAGTSEIFIHLQEDGNLPEFEMKVETAVNRISNFDKTFSLWNHLTEDTLCQELVEIEVDVSCEIRQCLYHSPTREENVNKGETLLCHRSSLFHIIHRDSCFTTKYVVQMQTPSIENDSVLVHCRHVTPRLLPCVVTLSTFNILRAL
jgi:hypothetical protein